MKNYEKYETKINEYNGGEFCVDFVMPYILGSDNCAGMDCVKCRTIQTIWLLKEYEESKEPKEPEVNWNKIEVDTPVLVKNKENEEWKKRHLAKYEHGRVYVWNNGSTSWSACRMYDYKYAKLPEDQKEPEIDWNKIKVDTPILVRNSKDGKWLKRYFAKYEDNKIYTWLGETTSCDACGVTKWKYAKLIESEEE